jgi:hypothetical protein
VSAELQREHLLAVAQQHDVELQHALLDLRDAVKRPFDVAEHLKTQVSDHPVPWLVSALLIGVWLGSR